MTDTSPPNRKMPTVGLDYLAAGADIIVADGGASPHNWLVLFATRLKAYCREAAVLVSAQKEQRAEVEALLDVCRSWELTPAELADLSGDVSPLVPAPPEPPQEYTTGYNGLLTPEESTARLEAMADESDRLASEAEKQDIRVNAKQDAIEWRLDAYAIREALRAAAARSPQPTEHQAFVAVMNALDIHMPPDGQNLLDELRKIAQTVGYPWRGLVAARSPTPAAQAWQPISTAPEATAVLVFLPNYGTITANRTDKIWWWNYGHGQVVYPTHWMPIPAPPVGSPAPAKETP